MTSSYEALHNSIRSKFKSTVEDTQGIIVEYDNFPDDHLDDTKWIRFSIKPAGSTNIESGGTGVLTFGIARATIFVPIHLGDEQNLELVDVIINAFQNTETNGVKYRVPTVTVRGREVDSKWWEVDVDIPFFCYESTP